MDIIQYAENQLNLELTYFQRDALALLEQDPDAHKRIFKPRHDMRLVLDIFKKWQEYNNNLVAC